MLVVAVAAISLVGCSGTATEGSASDVDSTVVAPVETVNLDTLKNVSTDTVAAETMEKAAH